MQSRHKRPFHIMRWQPCLCHRANLLTQIDCDVEELWKQ